MQEFKKNILLIYGETGKKWLDSLPDVLLTLAKKYNLTRLSPVENMSFHYVASGFQKDIPIIVKIGLDKQTLAAEAACLRAFSSPIAAKIRANDDNMIIMERAIPATTLREYFPNKESETAIILCSVINTLHRTNISKNHSFRHVSDLLATLDRNLDVPKHILSKAKTLRYSLLSSTKKEVLLHGDLHHDNILKNGTEWLVIDPKGLIGDPAFEFAAYLCNPVPELLQQDHIGQIIANRLKVCSEISQIPEQRLKDWLYVKLVLCWAYSLDDNLNPEGWIKILESLEDTSIKL